MWLTNVQSMSQIWLRGEQDRLNGRGVMFNVIK